VSLITQTLGQPLSEVPYWIALPHDVFMGVIEQKRKEMESMNMKPPEPEEPDFSWAEEAPGELEE